MARKVKELCHKRIRINNDYWSVAAISEATLILGNIDAAETLYSEASDLAKTRLGDLCTTRHQARHILKCFNQEQNRLDHCFNILTFFMVLSLDNINIRNFFSDIVIIFL